jgi:hypothetical protein
MRHLRLLAAACGLFVAAAAFAATDPTYTALRGSRPDGRTIAVSSLAFDRDVYHLTLMGTLHLLAPVDGTTPGAVFLGTGTYELKPVGVNEKRSLIVNTGDDKLVSFADKFDTAVFFSGDLLKSAEAQAGAAKSGAPDARAVSAYEDYLKRQRKDLKTNIHVRVLQAILNGEKEPLFFGFLKGGKVSPAVIAVDPRGVESLRLIGGQLGGEQTMLMPIGGDRAGVWYLTHLKSEVDSGKATEIAPLTDAENYNIDTKVIGGRGGEIAGTTTMTLANLTEGLRLLPIHLMGKLRITDASFSPAGATPTWTPAAFIQEKDDEDSDAAVVFPAALKAGEKYLLKMTYGGKDVLFDAGDGNFSVGARTSWYPNVGVFGDLATYDLTFRMPQKFQIVAVGDEVSNKVEGDSRVAVWKSAGPLRVAGFNYGRFKKVSQADADSGMTVDVYTNPGTPDVINEINRALESGGSGLDSLSDPEAMTISGGPTHVRIDTGKLAQSAIADGVNTARTGNAFFGPLPAKHVAITQQSAWSFGQSWPQLIYLPYVAFLDGTTRNTLGLNDLKDFVDLVGPHEFAHQWWGHQVGDRSYHDTWLVEGFAEFTAALVLQQTSGWPAYNSLWEKKRRYILQKPRSGTLTNDAVGPISMGWRLISWQNTSAYDAMVYEKGAYVLHMLRMAMQDRSKKNQDEKFMAMMHEFAQTYAGKNATTADFQRVAEKYTPKNLDLQGGGKLDWFFKEWVYGTSIPKLDAKVDFSDAGGGKYHIKATITQSQVTDDFATVVPLYVQFEKGQMARLATVPIVGNTSKPIEFDIPLPMKPKAFVINAMHDVLAR